MYAPGTLVLWTWQVPLQAALRLKFGEVMAIDGVADGAFARVTDALSGWLYVECSFFTIYRVLLVGTCTGSASFLHSCVSLSL